MRTQTIAGFLIAMTMTGALPERGAAQGRDFDAEIEDALRSAKSAAGFEWLGTLNRLCLLPASRGVNTSDDERRPAPVGRGPFVGASS